MQNYKKLEEVKKTADNSVGSALNEQQRYMDSLSGKINSLKENLVGLFMDMSNTEFIKSGIGGVNNLVSGLRTLINTFGALPTTIGVVSGSMVLLNKEFKGFLQDINLFGFGTVEQKFKQFEKTTNVAVDNQKRAISTLKEFRQTQEGAGMSTVSYASKMSMAQAKVLAYKTEIIAARIATSALQMTMSALTGIGIGIIVEGVIKLADSIVNAKKNLRDFNEEFQKTTTQENNNISEAEEKYKSIQRIQKQLSGTNDQSEKLVLQKELNKAQREMAQIMPKSISNYDEEGKAISGVNAAIEQQINLKKQQQSDKANDFLDKNKKSLKTTMEEYSSLQNKQKNLMLKDQRGEKSDEWVNGVLGIPKRVEVKDALSKVNQELADGLDKMLATKQAMQSKKNIGWNDDMITSKFGVSEKAVDTFLNSINQASYGMDDMSSSANNGGNSVERLAEAMEKGEKQAKEYADSFSKLGGNVEIAKKALQEMTKYGKLSNDTVASILNSGDTKMISSLGNKANFVKNMTEAMKDSEKQQKQSYDNAVRLAMATENQKNAIAQNGANQRGQISADEVNKKGALDQQDANNQGNSEIAKNNNAINGNNSRNQIEANGVNTKNGLYNNDSLNQGVGENNKVSNTSGAVNSIVSMSADMTNVLGSNYSADASNFSRALNQKLAAISQYVSNASRMLSSVLGFSTGGYFGKMVDQVKESMMPTSGDSSYDPIDAGGGFEPVSYSPVGYSNDKLGGSGSGKKKKGSKSKKPKSSGEKVDIKDIEEEVDRYKSLQDALDDVNNELERNNQLKDLAQGSDKLKYMREENSLYIEKKKAIHDLINAKKQEARELEGILNSNGFDAVNGDISNYQSKLNQIKNEANSMANSNKKKEDAIKRYKKLEEQANKYFDLTSKELPNLQKEWEDVNKAMKDAEREKVEMIGNAEREMVDVIKENLDKKKELYNKDWDERKKLLDEEYDKKKETLDKETEALKKALQDQKDIMNNQFEDENYKSQLSDKEEELAKLQQQIDEASRNTTLEGQNMLNDLLEQKKKLEEERDKFIKEHQQNMANDLFDKEMDKIDKDSQDKGDKLDDEHKLNSDILDKEKEEREKEWDKHFSAEKISELAKQLVHQGFAEVNGEVLKLGDAVKKYFVSQGEVFSDSSLKLQELMDKIKVAQGLAQDLNNMNKNLGVSSSNNIRTFMNNPNYQLPIASFMALPTIQNNQKPNITINSDLNIGEIKNGQSPDEMQRMFAEHKQDIIKTINRELDNY
ncbi:MAG: hypothetical protein ACRCW0_00850 [Clostridium sp.]